MVKLVLLNFIYCKKQKKVYNLLIGLTVHVLQCECIAAYVHASFHFPIHRSTSFHTPSSQEAAHWGYRIHRVSRISILQYKWPRTSSTLEFPSLEKNNKVNSLAPLWPKYDMLMLWKDMFTHENLTMLLVVQPLSCVFISIDWENRAPQSTFLWLCVQKRFRKPICLRCFNVRHDSK